MSLWIKICGNTSIEDARLAVEAGADALGFVFAPSPRQVTASEVAGIGSRLPATVERIGVFVDAGLEEIYSTVRASRLSGVQLHFDAGPELPAKLRELLGPWLRILRVVHFDAVTPNLARDKIAEHARNPDVDAVLVDSRTDKAVGGTGVAFDWPAARKALFQNAGARQHLIVAGGLTPENVAKAVATLRPWGVDVASGVEAELGRKDPFMVREFIARARAADRK
jgi:phosphoribosylanthranilate isomerase